MKKTLLFRRIFAAVLLLTVSTISWANGTKINGIYYVLDSSTKTASVTYTGTTSSYNPSSTAYTGSITIPSTVTYNSITYSVTRIGEYAFHSCNELTSITIPETIISIGDGVFSGCTSLEAVNITDLAAWCGISFVTGLDYNGSNPLQYAHHLFIDGEEIKDLVIPSNVTRIGGRAFDGCLGLTSIMIPESVTSIGEEAFYDTGLTKAEFASIESLCKIEFGSSGANPLGNAKLYINGQEITDLVIPNSVTSIGSYAFSCSGLTSVTIPNSVTSIGKGAFYNCSGLTKAEFASIESLCKMQFGNNESNPLYYSKHLYINGQEITDLIIPESVTSIGNYAFNGCTGLTSITIPESVTSIEECAFYRCTGLTSVTIPNSVTSIGSSAFQDCTGLTSITIPNGVTSIGSSAFSWCSGLTSVTISNSVTSIGNYAFYECSNLRLAFIGSSVTSIGEQAFSGCTGLTSITIPNGVTSIGSSAFSWCSGLTSVTIPNSVTSIGNYAFYGCSGLTSVNIPNSVTSIGESAFRGCTGLTSITIPNSVTSIGNSAFSNCSGLTSIVVDKDNTYYDSRDNCNAIIQTSSNTLISGCKSTVIPPSVTSIGWSAFEYCSGLTSITIPNSVTSIGYDAFYGCSGLTSVTIGNSVISIGERAFEGCSGLKEVYCQSQQVPNASQYAFNNTDIASATLYVPASAVDDYKSTAPWSGFGNIVALEAGASVANMRITDAGWATFWAPFAVDIPAGVKAYTGEMRDGWIRMIELTNGIIPGNTGVVLQLVDAEPFEIDLEPSATQPNEVVPSCYTGNTTGATMEVEIGDYLLQKNFNNERQEYVVGWYKVESPGFTLARNRCYLAKATVAEQNQARPFLGFEPIDDATGISSIATEAKTKAGGKYMVKGQVVVVKAGKAYNMNGTEIK